MNKEEKTLLNIKTKRSDNSSSKGSDDYIFSNKNNSTYTIKHISKCETFLEQITDIKNPSYTTDLTFLKKSNFLEKIKNPANFEKENKFPFPIDDIDKSKIFPIFNARKFFKVDNDKSQTCNFIFSNLFIDENKKEEEIFQNMHKFCNKYFEECEISTFCPDYLTHFPKNDINKFYAINRDYSYVELMKAFHYHDYGIAHFYSPKGTGKSILFRSIFVNFNNYYTDEGRYTPLMFFNISLLYELIKQSNTSTAKKILLHEAYSLFRKREDSIKLINSINISQNNVMKIIFDIITNALKVLKEKRKVFILDSYSCEYDPENILEQIKNYVLENKKFFVEIVYDIKTLKDGEKLFNNIAPTNHINYNVDYPEKYFYFEELKLFSQIKANFQENEIPEEYSKIFGENVSYFFEFKKKKEIDFKEFTKQKKLEIKNEILKFCDGKGHFYLGKIEEYIKKEEKFSYDDIIKFIPGNYIQIIIEPKPNPLCYGEDFDEEKFPKYYSLKYSFPLIGKIIQEILEDNHFINMKNPQFLNLPPAALGINFEIEMNKIFQKLIDDECFFGHTKKIKIFIENILEKKEKEKGQIYKKKDVILKIEENKYLCEKKNSFKNINFNQYTCTAVFQEEFCGKAFDTLFFVKQEEENSFNMILIQIKCSDSYKEDKKELVPQATYVKEKFEYLLNIKINNIYVTYLSIYEKPKKFANDNKNRTFLYNINEDKFVGFDGVEFKKFPILEDSIIYTVDESNILNKIIGEFIEYYNRPIKLIKTIKNMSYFQTGEVEKIKNNLNKNELYVNISPSKIQYYYKIDNFFGYNIKEGTNFCEGVYENIFIIK